MLTIIMTISILGQIPEGVPTTPNNDKIKIEKIYILHNNIRQKYSIQPLKKDEYLDKYAKWWAHKMATSVGLTHSKIKTIMQYDNYMSAAENIAMGQTSEEEVIQSWMKSSGHRKNILGAQYNKIGCGRYKNYWCTVFARKWTEEDGHER